MRMTSYFRSGLLLAEKHNLGTEFPPLLDRPSPLPKASEAVFIGSSGG